MRYWRGKLIFYLIDAWDFFKNSCWRVWNRNSYRMNNDIYQQIKFFCKDINVRYPATVICFYSCYIPINISTFISLCPLYTLMKEKMWVLQDFNMNYAQFSNYLCLGCLSFPGYPTDSTNITQRSSALAFWVCCFVCVLLDDLTNFKNYSRNYHMKTDITIAQKSALPWHSCHASDSYGSDFEEKLTHLQV